MRMTKFYLRITFSVPFCGAPSPDQCHRESADWSRWWWVAGARVTAEAATVTATPLRPRRCDGPAVPRTAACPAPAPTWSEGRQTDGAEESVRRRWSAGGPEPRCGPLDAGVGLEAPGRPRPRAAPPPGQRSALPSTYSNPGTCAQGCVPGGSMGAKDKPYWQFF